MIKNQKPNIILTTSGATSFCSGDSLIIQANTNTGSPIYQWYKANNVINNATNSSYTVKAAGKYKVKVTNISTGCSKISSQISVTVDCKNVAENSIKVLTNSNPFANTIKVMISCSGSERPVVKIIDLTGRVIHEYANIDILVPFEIGEDLSSGLYLIQVITELNQQIIKIIKQ